MVDLISLDNIIEPKVDMKFIAEHARRKNYLKPLEFALDFISSKIRFNAECGFDDVLIDMDEPITTLNREININYRTLRDIFFSKDNYPKKFDLEVYKLITAKGYKMKEIDVESMFLHISWYE